MVFNSLEFAVFFPIVLVLYWRLRRRPQNFLLLIASWTFYAFFDWRFLGLMLVSTCVDYQVGRVLRRVTDDRVRLRVFLVSLTVNLGILGFFKYFNFFVDSGVELLDHFGLAASAPALRILLPVGISFYTFHGISYTFDVYRRQIEPARSFLDFAVFVAYFPQLVAGPIGRAHIQLPQFERDRVRPSAHQVRSALLLIVVGLFRKIVIADAIAPHVNAVFADTKHAGWVALLVGTFGFAIQIYGDFSGYSSIARGTSRLLGIELPVNFTQPYLSRNITEFWQRWHISLSTWLRDYLYVPLGGNRGSRWATYRNLMITMLLGGLWHGAALTFVVWGAIHGALLSSHRWMRDRRARLGRPEPMPGALGTAARVAATFTLASLAFVVFRARGVSDAVHVVQGLVTLRPGPVPVDAVVLVALATVAALASDLLERAYRAQALVLRTVPTGLAVGAMSAGMVVFSGGTPVPFIYFQF